MLDLADKDFKQLLSKELNKTTSEEVKGKCDETDAMDTENRGKIIEQMEILESNK